MELHELGSTEYVFSGLGFVLMLAFVDVVRYDKKCKCVCCGQMCDVLVTCGDVYVV